MITLGGQASMQASQPVQVLRVLFGKGAWRALLGLGEIFKEF